MSRIVILQNELPTFLLPEGMHEGDARQLCLKMRDEHPTNIRQKKETPWARWPAIAFDWITVKEYEP